MEKEEILVLALEKVDARIQELEILLIDLKDSLIKEEKSSAGDKHETSRAMVQLEQEKLARQLGEFMQMRNILKQINPKIQHTKIGIGSLVATTSGWYFISVGLGQIQLENKVVFTLNPQAPLGKELIGKKVGDSFLINGSQVTIIEVK